MNVSSTKISSLNLSNNTELLSINVTKNTSLKTLNLSNNKSISTLNYDEGITITSGFNISSVINVNGAQGIVCYRSKNTTKIISTDEFEGKLFMGGESMTDGMTNTNNPKNIDSGLNNEIKKNGPAWYVPAVDELIEIIQAINNNKSQPNGMYATSSYHLNATYDPLIFTVIVNSEWDTPSRSHVNYDKNHNNFKYRVVRFL